MPKDTQHESRGFQDVQKWALTSEWGLRELVELLKQLSVLLLFDDGADHVVTLREFDGIALVPSKADRDGNNGPLYLHRNMDENSCMLCPVSMLLLMLTLFPVPPHLHRPVNKVWYRKYSPKPYSQVWVYPRHK